jgi:hypothetical protein
MHCDVMCCQPTTTEDYEQLLAALQELETACAAQPGLLHIPLAHTLGTAEAAGATALPIEIQHEVSSAV